MSSSTPTTGQQASSSPLTSLAKARVSTFYKLGLATVAAAMLLLPLLYLAFVAAVGWGIYLFIIHCVPAIVVWDFRIGYITLVAMFVCIVTPLATGCAVLFFMIKPIFAGRRRAPVGAVHNSAFEPRVGDLIEGVCRAVGATAPRRQSRSGS